MSAITLDDLAGLWRRDLLTAPSVEDRTTRVWWAQGATLHADLRVPDPYDAAACEGFAGITTVEGGTCEWHRRINLRGPVTGRDIGALSWRVPGEVLIETGVEATYTEVWTRVDASLPESTVFERGGGEIAVILWSASFFLIGRGDPAAMSGAAVGAGCYTFGRWDDQIGVATLSTDQEVAEQPVLRWPAADAVELREGDNWDRWFAIDGLSG